MDHKTVKDIVNKYYVKNGQVAEFGGVMVTDEDIKVEALLSWYIIEETANRRRIIIDENYKKVQEAMSQGIILEQQPQVPGNDELTDQIIADFGINGEVNDSPNNVAIRAILENENHVEITEPLLGTDAYNTSFLTGETRKLGLIALRYVARKKGVDIDPNTIKIDIEEDTENKQVIINVAYTKKPIEKVQEEKQTVSDPVIPPVSNPTAQAEPEPLEPPLVDDEQNEPEPLEPPIVDDEPVQENNQEGLQGSGESAQPEPLEPPLVDGEEPEPLEPPLVDDEPVQEQDAKDVAPQEEPQEQPVEHESIFDRIKTKVTSIIEGHKEKKKNAKLDSMLSIEDINLMIEESKAMGDIDSQKYWTNILCQKQGLPLQYPELVEQQQISQIDSQIEHIKEEYNSSLNGDQEKASKLKDALDKIEEKRKQLKKLDTDTEYITCLLNEALASNDEVTSSRMTAILDDIQKQKDIAIEELKSLIDIEQILSTPTTVEAPTEQTPVVTPQEPPKVVQPQVEVNPEPTGEQPQEEENTITIDFIADELKKAINNDDIEDIEGLIALTEIKFPYASTKRYLDKINLGYSQDAKDNVLALVDILKITLPGYESELDKYEKYQSIDSNLKI